MGLTNEEILEMANDADFFADTKLGLEYHPDWHDERDKYFARLIEQATREEDAKIAESEADDAKYNGVEPACLRIAETIRSQK
jgi:hypothetical protein